MRIECGPFYLIKRDDSPFWFVRASHPKRRPLFKSTKTSDEKRAKRVGRELYDDWAKEKKLKPGDKILWADLWDEFTEKHFIDLRDATKKRIESVGRLHLKPYFDNLFLTEVQGAWNGFSLAQRKKRPGSTLFNERKYLLASMQYAFENGLIDREPYLAPLKTDKEAPGKVYSEAEITRLFEKCEHDSLKLHILMALTMGMRLSEIGYLETDRIDLKARTLTLRAVNTKTRKARTIAMSDRVATEVGVYLKNRSKASPWLFPQAHNLMRPTDIAYTQKLWQDLKTEAKVTGRFHDLRHTCATKLAKSGVAAEVACAYLGMSLRVYDQIYCHLNETDTAEAAGVVRLPE